MDRYLSDAAASDLGLFGEDEAGCLNPNDHMVQLWKQQTLVGERPAYIILYHRGVRWHQVPRSTVRQAVRQVVGKEAFSTRDLAGDIHTVIHMAMQITGGALALLAAIDQELTATGL